MEVSFTNANPEGSGESFLLRFESEAEQDTACVLVDSGDGVDVDSLLDGDEYLSAILLTHGHADHYCTLPKNHRSSVSVLTSPDTARMLPTILRANTDYITGVDNIDNVLDHVQPMDDGWVTIVQDVEVRAVPVGHAPGACGFVLRLNDEEEQHILVTGDFTRRAVAGNPGISSGYPVSIDCVFLNSAVQNNGAEKLTEALDQVMVGILGSENTLLATEGFEGVHFAHLLAAISDRHSLSLSIVLAGKAGILYDQLDRNHSAITTVPEFDDVDEVLSRGDVCIAGPSMLDRGSAYRLYHAIKDEANGSVISVGNNHPDELPSGVSHFPYIGHPTQTDLEELVESLYPKDIVIEHGNLDHYGTVFDFGYTWCIDEPVTYRIYADGRWYPPRWVTETTRKKVHSAHFGNGLDAKNIPSESDAETWPSLDATETIPAEEGVDMSGIHGGKSNRETTTKYAPTRNCGGKAKEETDSGTAVAEATTDGGATAPMSESGGPRTEENHTGQASKERVVQAAEDFLEEVREADSSDCETVGATVITSDDGTCLLRVNEEEMEHKMEHHDQVTATIHINE